MQNSNSKLKINKLQQLHNAIVLRSVSKKYTLSKERPLLLKNLFIPSKKEEIWALKDVSLTIKKGETIGIIGENGSGKSTLLKIISGITSPTSGSVQINGRVASLIELGAGFHQDLTGQENVYLNAALMGLTKKEIDERYKKIIEFADIGEFIEQPVRTYSSGMTVRLGFSVAVHLDPDILLIDEVLAVGDEEFQRKCISRIAKLREEKKTIIIVSHNLYLLEQISEVCYWLEKAKLRMKDLPGKVIKDYIDKVKNKEKRENKSKRHGTGEVQINKIKLLSEPGKEKNLFETGENIIIRLFYKCKREIEKPNFGVAIYRSDGVYCYGINSLIDNKCPTVISGRGCLDLCYPKIPLLQGEYSIELAIYGKTELDVYDYISKAKIFKVGSNKKDQGLVFLPHEWNIFVK